MQAWERYTCPESVVSTWIVGTDPVICTSKDGDEVMESEDSAESRTSDVFLHPTTRQLVTETFAGSKLPIEMAFTLPDTRMTDPLQPKICTAWCNAVSVMLMSLLSSWFS
jgi:hypothetical protein